MYTQVHNHKQQVASIHMNVAITSVQHNTIKTKELKTFVQNSGGEFEYMSVKRACY